MNDEGLGIVRIADGRLEAEPVDKEAEQVVQEAKEMGRKVRILPETEETCPLDPDVPEPLTICAALEDPRASRAGEMDFIDLVERFQTREVLRDRWERDELDEEDLLRLTDE